MRPWPRGPCAAILVALTMAVAAGCIERLLDEHADSKMAFICGALDGAEPFHIVVHGDGVEGAADLLAREVGALGRDGGVAVVQGEDPAPGADDWPAWRDDNPFRDRRGLRLHVLWLPDAEPTGLQVAPGAFAVSRAAVTEGAARLERGEDEVAAALLLHHAGHALGIVNDGVPVQNPAIQERERPPTHDARPASVMHVGWEDVSTMQWHGPYRYSDEARADWAGMQEVCA